MLILSKAIQEMPKVLLHDHLDGGLRPETVIELAKRSQIRQTSDDRSGRACGMVPSWCQSGKPAVVS